MSRAKRQVPLNEDTEVSTDYSTDKVFDAFCTYHTRYCQRLNLANWCVMYTNDEDQPGWLASTAVDADMDSMCTTVNLACVWPIEPTDQQIQLSAAHEACELFLWVFEDMALRRTVSPENISRERHSLIRVLEKILTDDSSNNGGGK